MSIRFNEEELRDQGRNTVGVWGIPSRTGRLRSGRSLDGQGLHAAGGRWKTASASARALTSTACKAAAAKASSPMKTNEKTGGVAGALTVRDADELMLITNKGKMVRTKVAGIRETGRERPGRHPHQHARRREPPGHRPGGQRRRGRGSRSGNELKKKGGLRAALFVILFRLALIGHRLHGGFNGALVAEVVVADGFQFVVEFIDERQRRWGY